MSPWPGHTWCMSSQILRRQPRGRPTGGQFAEHQRANSGLALSDADDPWLDLDPADDPWASDAANQQDAELDDLIKLADQVARATTSPAAIGRDEVEQGHARWEAFRTLNDELTDRFGSVEQAATTVGARIAARAETHAGISAEEVAESYQQRLQSAKEEAEQAQEAKEQAVKEAREKFGDTRQMLLDARNATDDQQRARLREAYNQAWQATDEYTSEARSNANRAMVHLSEVSQGLDEQTMADLRRLSDGYTAALSQVRDMGGGQMRWHSKTAKKARTAFDEAATIFPTDWIEASNNRITSSNERGGAPLAKISRRRAHYMDRQLHRSTTCGPDRSLATGFAYIEEDMSTYGRSSSPHREFTELTSEELEANGYTLATGNGKPYWHTRYTVANRFDHGTFDEDTPPRGRGWEKWVNPAEPTDVRWRRPKIRVRTSSFHSAPEITTNAMIPAVQGRSATFAVCAHELSHRFEYSVEGITGLEREFLKRRTTDPATGLQQEPRPLWRGSKERARAGDFISAYTGKDYGEEAFEVLSTGVDALFGGRRGGLVGTAGMKQDLDHRNFVLGVMATAGRQPDRNLTP